MGRSRIALVTMLGVVLLASTAQATPSRIDRSVGTNGIVRLEAEASAGAQVGTRYEFIRDGDDSSGNDVLEVFTSPGTRDTTWGTGGVTTLPPVNYGFIPESLSAAPDGSLTVIGREVTDLPNERPVLMRLTPSGAVDTTFGNAGVLRVPNVGYLEDEVEVDHCLDGSMYVSSFAYKRGLGEQRTLIRKLSATGDAVPTFAAAAPVVESRLFGSPICTESGNLAFVGSTRSYRAGFTGTREPAKPAVGSAYIKRYAADGSVASTRRIAMLGLTDVVRVDSQPSGTTLLGITELRGLRVRRVLADGTLDSSFGIRGVGVRFSPSFPSFDMSFHELPDGRTYATGTRLIWMNEPSLVDFRRWVAVFDERGQLDQSAGTWFIPPALTSGAFSPSIAGVFAGRPFFGAGPATGLFETAPTELAFVRPNGGTVPDTTPPRRVRVLAPTRFGRNPNRLRWSWTPSIDTGAGTSYYEARGRHTGDRRWSGAALRGPAGSTSVPVFRRIAILSLKPNRGMCVQVRPVDRAGNVGPWSKARCVRHQSR